MFDGSSLVRCGRTAQVVARAASFAEDLVVFDTEALDGGACGALRMDEDAATLGGAGAGDAGLCEEVRVLKALVGLERRD